MVTTALALALTLSNGSPRCEVAADVVDVAHWGDDSGVSFDAWLLDGASSSCGPAPSMLVAPSPYSELFVRGTPWVQPGDRVRALVRAYEGVWVVDVSSGVSREASAFPGDAIRKPGNNVPPCMREEALRWRDDRVSIELDPAGFREVEGSTEAWLRAARAWSAPACGGARLEPTIGAAVDAFPLQADGRSTVSVIREPSLLFGAGGLADGLGITCYVCDDEGWIVESDVRFNDAGIAWSTGCEADGFDVLGTALHEFGHVLGFAHDEEPASVMFAFTSERRLLSSRRLDSRDIDGLCARYPCSDDACAATIEVDANCPPGVGVCGACVSDGECGASTDRCLDAEGAMRCSRACSPSFPCPTGLECASIGGGESQCAPASPLCVDDGVILASCVSDEDCGGAPRRCESGTCSVGCGEGLACPDGGTCVETLDADGRVLSARCEGASYVTPPPPGGGGGGGCGCSVAPATSWGTAWFALLWAARTRRTGHPRRSNE